MARPPRDHSPAQRDRILARLAATAARQGGVISRAEAYAAGLTRGEVRAQVRADRWQRVWTRSLCVHTGEVSAVGRHWAAVFEGGGRAMLDGESSLIASGLEHYDSPVLRVSVPRGVKPLRGAGLDIRRTRRWRGDERAASGVPRTRVPIAAVRAAMWAVSDKQAALLLTMPVQQGMTTAERLGEALLDVKRDRRLRLMHGVVLDLLGGARSLGELDFARECRRRGLPEPTRQSVRKGRDGRYYLDVRWDDYQVVVEIDGVHHTWAPTVVPDALRQNEVTLESSTVLRLPLLGLRVAADDFFDQIERALRAGGWPPAMTSYGGVMGAGCRSDHLP
jgi:very-short-patch-repair endonuclease